MTRQALALVLLPTKTCPPPLALGLRLRASANATGKCACGAHVDLSKIPDGEAVQTTMLHEADCPAGRLTFEQVQRGFFAGHVRNALVVADVEEAA